MGIVGVKIKKSNSNRAKELEEKLKELWHYLEGVEFAEKKGVKDLEESYKKEAIETLIDIKKAYGDLISKWM